MPPAGHNPRTTGTAANKPSPSTHHTNWLQWQLMAVKLARGLGLSTTSLELWLTLRLLLPLLPALLLCGHRPAWEAVSGMSRGPEYLRKRLVVTCAGSQGQGDGLLG